MKLQISLYLTSALDEGGLSTPRYGQFTPYPQERLGTQCIGGWVGPRAGLDGCRKSHQHRDLIPGQSTPYWVAIDCTIPAHIHMYIYIYIYIYIYTSINKQKYYNSCNTTYFFNEGKYKRTISFSNWHKIGETHQKALQTEQFFMRCEFSKPS